MTTPIEELKIRARLLLNALGRSEPAAVGRALGVVKRRRWTAPQAWSLSLCLNIVAVEAGFAQWEHARRVLAGEARAGDDMGTLWYGQACAALMNRWCASYTDALSCLQTENAAYLLPYARQFIVADADFIASLGLSPASPHWSAIGRDLVAGYGTPAWSGLLLDRLQRMSPRSTGRD